MRIILNGDAVELPATPLPYTLQQLIAARGLQPDRVAVERNGVIVPRSLWSETALDAGDRLEIVHFVGGGSAISDQEAPTACPAPQTNV